VPGAYNEIEAFKRIRMQAGLLNMVAHAYSETGAVSMINTSTAEEIRSGPDVSPANICPIT
jgi:hypothetical protein